MVVLEVDDEEESGGFGVVEVSMEMGKEEDEGRLEKLWWLLLL